MACRVSTIVESEFSDIAAVMPVPVAGTAGQQPQRLVESNSGLSGEGFLQQACADFPARAQCVWQFSAGNMRATADAKAVQGSRATTSSKLVARPENRKLSF